VEGVLAELGAEERGGRYVIEADPAALLQIAQRLRDLGAAFSFLSATDYPQESRIELTYGFRLPGSGGLALVKVSVGREAASVDSICGLFPGACFSEAEAYDLVGVEFRGNPKLRRGFLAPLELAERGVFPLRKDSGA